SRDGKRHARNGPDQIQALGGRSGTGGSSESEIGGIHLERRQGSEDGADTVEKKISDEYPAGRVHENVRWSTDAGRRCRPAISLNEFLRDPDEGADGAVGSDLAHNRVARVGNVHISLGIEAEALRVIEGSLCSR